MSAGGTCSARLGVIEIERWNHCIVLENAGDVDDEHQLIGAERAGERGARVVAIHIQSAMRVGVARGAMWTATAPTKLFERHYSAAAFHFGRTYDVSPDGRRFLMIKAGAVGDASATPASMVVVLKWTEELKARVPTNKS